MKTKYLITSLWLLVFAFMVNTAGAQVKLPADFEQKTAKKYAALKNKEISFARYLEIQQQRYSEEQPVANSVSAVYNGCDETTNTICGNGTFEPGLSLDAAQWDGAFGQLSGNGTINFANLTEGIAGGPNNSAASRQTIVNNSTFDETVPTLSRVAPGSSTQALRIGNAAGGEGTELVSKRITVTSAQTILRFMYAVVFQDPPNSSHTAEEHPSFWVRVVDCANGQPITGVVNLGNGLDKLIADATDPFFQSANNGNIAFRDWDCGTINLSAHIGKTVVIQFITEDCTQNGGGGHAGYAYIDNLCGDCPVPGGGALSLASQSDCGNGRICLNYTRQQLNGVTGTVQLSLAIYQNGLLLQTLNSPALSSGTQYCFNINPTTIPGINDALGGFDYVITGNFTINGFVSQIILGNPPTGQASGQNNDYRIYCIDQCCPGRNVVRNPGFEEGNLYFSSAYTYQPSVYAGSVSTGRYGVMTSAQTTIVSPTWDVDCINNGKHLVVNGATGTGFTRIAWTQNVTVSRGKTYKFCADMKNLAQCGFDVKPKVDVQFGVPGFDLNDVVIDVPNGNCNWQNVSQVITMPAGSGTFTMSIRIYLDETGIGDGNDLAIDNITLVEIDPVPLSELLFNVNFFNVTSSQFSISAEPVAPLGRNCGFYWGLEEVNDTGGTIAGTAVYNPAQWWPLNPNTFNGYVGTSTLSGNNPGVFDINKRYRIVYGRWCECAAWNAYSVIVDPLRSAGDPKNIQVIKDDKYIFNPALSGAVKKEAVPVAVNPVAAAPETPAKEMVQKIKLYPNPADDNLVVELPERTKAAKISITNMQGITIKEVNTGLQQRLNINTQLLVPGTYLLRVVQANGEITGYEKFVKLKK
ncbi:MAG: T9SS type A sorting domain-containing protein [Dinghuibacter sp.]|nr:T9SS type A sorting domain-containing protein [Dinghuibacter sp.]